MLRLIHLNTGILSPFKGWGFLGRRERAPLGDSKMRSGDDIQIVMPKATRFSFDGSASSYVGAAILGILITTLTLGICYPFAVVLKERWRCKHTFIDGQQLVFTGNATGLLGRWLLWLFLSIITLGIFLFWVAPRMQAWKTVNTEFATPSAPITAWAPNILQTP